MFQLSSFIPIQRRHGKAHCGPNPDGFCHQVNNRRPHLAQEEKERGCHGGALRWPGPSMQDIQRLPKTSNVLVGSACNPTTLSIVAYIFSLLDRTHEWLPHIQTKDALSAASAAGLHAWGLMLPTSTRTPGVCYMCTVAVRYDPLCALLKETQTWRIGTHTLGGVEGLVGGYQFVHWQRPPGELVYARATDLACVIKDFFSCVVWP